MYSSPTTTLGTTGYLASTGTAALLGQLWLAVALLVIGGTLLTIAKVLPRLAVEPVRTDDESRHRLRVTVNGRPVRNRALGRAGVDLPDIRESERRGRHQ